MNPGQDEVDALAAAIDQVVFHEASGAALGAPPGAMTLISHLHDSFPRVALRGGRRDRLQRRLLRALRLPPSEPVGSLARIEAEMNRRLAAVDPRWRPLVGGAALVILGVVGVAVWRQRSAIKPVVAAVR